VDLPYDFKTNETIYTQFGDWFAWLCVLISVILIVSTFWKGFLASQEALVGKVSGAPKQQLAVSTRSLTP
jgi:apolipoprotein N-acyltransferase